MIQGIGTDLIEITRIQRALERYGEKFARRILSPKEMQYYQERSSEQQPSFLAKRFAAKEACVKALGTGFRNGLNFHMIEIENNDLGQPRIELHQDAGSFFSTPPIIHLSISDEPPYALAFVVIEN